MKAAKRHPRPVKAVERWHDLIAHATCHHLVDVRSLFPATDQVGTALVFNIGGNDFRLICCVSFERQWLFFRRLVSHSEYDRIKVEDLCP